ncbi:hypothetical protein [Thiomicrospira sp.]|uniref:hypothetical protein n=1 Tax=Thiomicrospira sp. TaxID=935 RepID=UPI002F95AED6
MQDEELYEVLMLLDALEQAEHNELVEARELNHEILVTEDVVNTMPSSQALVLPLAKDKWAWRHSAVTWAVGSIALIGGLYEPGLMVLIGIFLLLPRLIMHANGVFN